MNPPQVPEERNHAANTAVMLDHVVNHALVTIAIENDQLFLYPQRSSDAVAYYRTSGSGADPAKPREIRWVVTGLKPGQRIEIEAKPGYGDRFKDTKFTITHPSNSVCSGPPAIPAKPAYALKWRYGVKLLDSTREINSIDPDVEIRDDP